MPSCACATTIRISQNVHHSMCSFLPSSVWTPNLLSSCILGWFVLPDEKLPKKWLCNKAGARRGFQVSCDQIISCIMIIKKNKVYLVWSEIKDVRSIHSVLHTIPPSHKVSPYLIHRLSYILQTPSHHLSEHELYRWPKNPWRIRGYQFWDKSEDPCRSILKNI